MSEQNINSNPFEEHGLTEEEADLSADLTIAPQKAWAKMSKSALAEPSDWLLCFIEAAILKGVTDMTVSFTGQTPYNIAVVLHD